MVDQDWRPAQLSKHWTQRGSPSSLLEATSCYCRPSILETTHCLFLAFPLSKPKLHKARTGVMRPHATVPPTCHLFFTTYSPTLGFALSIALFPFHFPAMASLSCCCLTAPDGYCRTDEVPSLSSENRHQPFSQRCFSFLLEISIRDQVRLCPQNTDLVHLKTSQ